MLNFGFGPKKKPLAMIILDGWGIAPPWGGNAVSLAEARNFSEIWRKCPSTTLAASDGAVGLPYGAPGNSEAGHLNIGAGKIVHQDQPIIDRQIEDGSFYKNDALLGAVAHAQKNNSNLHIMGLLSKTGTHSNIIHLYALLKLIKQNNFNRVFIHLFTDGRDSDSMSGIEMMNEVITQLRLFGIGRINTVVGRFFAMDRDNRWERVRKAYDLLTRGIGVRYSSPEAIFSNSYAHGITDEFIEPSVITEGENLPSLVNDNDGVIFFNFRSDRAKEITQAFLSPALPELSDRKVLSNLYFATFVMHDENSLAKAAFVPEKVDSPIGKVWSDKGLKQYHTAETEKYAHVTYFMNGGLETPYPGEDRLMIPSPKSVNTYDKLPEMSAGEVTKTLISAISKNIYDTFIVNFANPDMVGHTGNLKATIKAVEYVDYCLGVVLKEILSRNGTVFVFADHGNAEQMVNPKTGAPDTEHTSNPVPFVLVSNEEQFKGLKFRSDGVLASVAPTVLDLMGIATSPEMTEKSLIIK